MEYLEGEPLLAVLRAGRDGKRLDPLSTGRLIADTAEGLDAAHELRSMSGERLELVHHDIALGNIVVLYNGQVKLVDFGVAKAATSTVKTRSGALKGKIAYMSPEQARGSSIDRRSDLFSLGIVLWEMITTQRLFRGENDLQTLKLIINQPPRRASELQPACEPELERIVLRALAQDPAARYPTAAELLRDLEEVTRTQALAAEPAARR